MKTISDYSIYCTPEQTKKALKLSAPIEIKYGSINHKPSIEDLQYLIQYDNMWYKIPTAEQMIGWLEEQGIQISFNINCLNEWDCTVYNTLMRSGLLFQSIWETTRKEATLTAIDVALDYLTNNKKAK